MKKKAGSQFRTVFAHIVLILLSFMCLFFFFQKYMVKGLVAGAVKG